MFCGLVVSLILANEKMGKLMKSINFNMDEKAFESYVRRQEADNDPGERYGLQMPEGGKKVNKYFEKDVDSFAHSLSNEHTSVSDPFESQLVSTLKGMVKDESA